MADQLAVDSGDLWRWVDLLTQKRKRRLVRHAPGARRKVQWLDVDSLLDQLHEAQASTNGGGGHGKASGGSRPPLDLAITALLADIASTTIDALVSHDQQPHRREPANPRVAELGVTVVDLPASLRQLAATVVTTRDADLVNWWADRYRSWVARAETALGLEEPDALATRPVRGVACPACGVDAVVEDRDGDDVRSPALVIAFRDGQVVHVTCRHCDRGWWRGEELDQLGALVRPPDVDKEPVPCPS